jgi:hypothetical protein
VPEVVEDFFTQAAPVAGVHPRRVAPDSHVYRVGRVPRTLAPIGERLEPRCGRLGREYGKVVFDKALLPGDPTLEWITPGHPLFEAVREDVIDRAADHLRRGALFFDLQRAEPSRLDAFAASVKDGRGRTLHRRLYVVETRSSGEMNVRQPTLFLDVVPADAGTTVPDDAGWPDMPAVEHHLWQHALQGFSAEVAAERAWEIATIAEHVEISLNVLIDRQNLQLAELVNRKIEGATVPGLDGQIAQAEAHLDELNNRLEGRRRELAMERHCMIADITHLGRAWVLPHPARTEQGVAPMVQDEEIERIAVDVAMRHERELGREVESVEAENRGFDLISRRPHPEDPRTAMEVRFIEVKGRAGVGEIALSANEYRTAQRLGKDYWLYAVFNCASTPELHTIQDPARLDWQPVVQVEHYHIGASVLRKGGEQ